MITTNESKTCQQFSARNSSYLDHMALNHLDKNLTLPCLPTFKFTANASDLPNLYTVQQDCNLSHPTGNPYPKELRFAIDNPSLTPRKRFLIFDQSENHTRLFFSPFSTQDPIFTSRIPATANGLYGKVAAQLDQTKPILEEKWDENHLSDGEGDLLEDSEDIDALLYSDSDGDGYDDDDGENDEVTSTGNSPVIYNREKSINDEVASCDESSPKRQRLLDGNYKKPSSDSCSYENDYGVGPNKAKIREALKMLESIIPGLDNKDPLSIIDGAVVYLKSMKTEAESLGLSSLQ